MFYYELWQCYIIVCDSITVMSYLSPDSNNNNNKESKNEIENIIRKIKSNIYNSNTNYTFHIVNQILKI